MALSLGDLLANKYRIEAEIGRGAFGRVYRARDIALDRVVAIKELHKGEDDLGSTVFSDYVRRFEREARVQARFNHPNIVHVYELLRLADDRLYLAMEYVDGESLRDTLARRGPLPVDEALRMMGDLLAGLAAVHADERDIVHRDIKPSNVMLTRSGQAKLADFGLAQVGDESLRSGAGQPHPGSPLYMSPEQETTSAYLYPASDLFSVGCVLFEMLTGMPYKRAKKERKGLADLRPDTPPWVGEIVVAALAKDSDDRPANAAEMGRLLSKAKVETEVKAKAEAEERTRQEEAARQAKQQQLADSEAEQRQPVKPRRRNPLLPWWVYMTEAELAERAQRVAKRKIRKTEPATAARQRAMPWVVGVVAVLALVLAVWHPWTGGAPAALAPTQIPTLIQTPAPTKAPEPTKTPAAPVSGKPSVGIVLPTKDEPRWVQDETRFKDALAAAGYGAEILFSQGDSAKEAANVEALIAKGIKVLIICPQDSVATGYAANAAGAAGVTVIAYDRAILFTDAVDYYVAFDNIAIGVLQGQYLVDKAGSTKGNPLYLYAGAASDGSAFEFFQGAWSVLQPKIADGTFVIKNSREAVALQGKAELTRDEEAKIIGQVTTDWDFAIAGNLAEADLTVAKTADKGNVFVLAPNDGTARAIANVFATDKDVRSYVITGQDAEKASVQYIIDGMQSMTVFKDVRTLAKDAIAAAVALLEGKTPSARSSYNNYKIDVPMIQSALVFVDKANIKVALIDSGYYQASDFTGLK